MMSKPPGDPGAARSSGTTGTPAAGESTCLQRTHAKSDTKQIQQRSSREVQTCCVLRACRIPSQTGINDSINPKLISHMFVCSGS